MWLKVYIAFQSVEIYPSAACASALVQTSRVERWRCAPTSCRGSSQSGPSWNGMKAKISLVSRWSHHRLFRHFRTQLHNFTAAVTVCRLFKHIDLRPPFWSPYRLCRLKAASPTLWRGAQSSSITTLKWTLWTSTPGAPSTSSSRR